LNEQLDYFGKTVNIASRISHLSQGGDVVLSEAMMSDSEIRAEATRQGAIESFVTDVRGFDQRFELQRLIFAD
jgi:class 3 adenylate cyclase